jgi:MoaA/NifB/PqqE/SkfB family radical SAM enzyme
MLNLPYHCNYRCRKCFNLQNDEPEIIGNSLSLREVIAIIAEAKELGGRVVVIAGEGEPSLDPHIRKIVSAIRDAEMLPIIYSNGASLSRHLAGFYRSYEACLVIGLDSLRPDTHRFLAGTQHSFLPHILENISHLRELYADLIKVENGQHVLSLALNMTLCSRNMHEIEAIKIFAGDDIYFVCNPLACYGNASQYWPELIDSDQDFAEQLRLISEYSESGGPLTLDRSGLCGYSINGLGVSPCGHYMTCAYTKSTNGLLGNIRDRTLGEAYKLKSELETNHYKQYGNAPCLVRSDSFNSFIESCNASAQIGVVSPGE